MIISSEKISNALKSFGNDGPFPYEKSLHPGNGYNPGLYGFQRPGLSPLQSRWQDCVQALRLLLREVLLSWACWVGGKKRTISSANVRDQVSPLASGLAPAREAESAGDKTEVPEGRGLAASLCSRICSEQSSEPLEGNLPGVEVLAEDPLPFDNCNEAGKIVLYFSPRMKKLTGMGTLVTGPSYKAIEEDGFVVENKGGRLVPLPGEVVEIMERFIHDFCGCISSANVRDDLPGTAGTPGARSEATSTQSDSGGGLGPSLG